jgi:hypothetical protein
VDETVARDHRWPATTTRNIESCAAQVNVERARASSRLTLRSRRAVDRSANEASAAVSDARD